MLVLLQEIQFQKADLAIADLTINTPRNDAIDFSMPFMKLGLLKKGIKRTEFYTIWCFLGIIMLNVAHRNYQNILIIQFI